MVQTVDSTNSCSKVTKTSAKTKESCNYSVWSIPYCRLIVKRRRKIFRLGATLLFHCRRIQVLSGGCLAVIHFMSWLRIIGLRTESFLILTTNWWRKCVSISKYVPCPIKLRSSGMRWRRQLARICRRSFGSSHRILKFGSKEGQTIRDHSLLCPWLAIFWDLVIDIQAILCLSAKQERLSILISAIALRLQCVVRTSLRKFPSVSQEC